MNDAIRNDLNRPRTCHDCGTIEGHLHERGCDMERCPFCGTQLISCGCANKHFYPAYDVSSDPIGRMPTEEESAHARGCRINGCFACAVLFASGATAGLPVRVYYDGLSAEQEDEWDAILAAKGRVPWIIYPNMCCRCGELWPALFMVPDEEWDRYVEPAMRGYMLCKACWTWIKARIDGATHATHEIIVEPHTIHHIILEQPIGNCDGSREYAWDSSNREDGRGEKLSERCPGCRACS